MAFRSRCCVAAVLKPSTKFGKRCGRLSIRERFFALVDLRHDRRVGQDREGFLEALPLELPEGGAVPGATLVGCRLAIRVIRSPKLLRCVRRSIPYVVEGSG